MRLPADGAIASFYGYKPPGPNGDCEERSPILEWRDRKRAEQNAKGYGYALIPLRIWADLVIYRWF